MATKITSRVIAPGAVTAEALAPGVGAGPVIANVQIANSSYVALDDTAVALSGGYILINGENFGENVQVIIANTNATSVTYISSSLVRAQVPAKSAGSYIMYLVNTDTGATAIRVNAVTYSGTPTWSTGSSLADGAVDEAVSIQLSATSDTSVTYQLQAGSTLPAGLTLAANGLLSGTVTGLNQDTLYNFTIEAVDAENQDSPRSFSITITAGDQYINSVVLALNADSNTFITDASTNNFAITPNGDTRPSAFSPYNTSWSNFFDGNGDFLSVPSSEQLTLSTQNFTVEFWTNMSSGSSSYGRWIEQGGYTVNNTWRINRNADTDGVYFQIGSTSTRPQIVSSTTLTRGLWYHIALVRNNGTISLYINGVSEGTPITGNSTDFAANILYVGQGDGNYVAGHISNLRIVKGTALYTSNFTPPTSPLTAISGTSLLTCQSNRFKDNSTNNFTITRNGDVRVTSFGPFTETDTTTGSGYFDGSGDSVSAASNAAFGYGSGDFTIEYWCYPTSFGVTNIQLDQRTSGGTEIVPTLYTDSSSGTLYYYVNGSNRITGGNLTLNTWQHIAVSRSGTSTKLFVNGTQVGSTYTDNNSYATSLVSIGAYSPGASLFFNGYISNLRIVKGTAVYTSNFTPPTSPLTAITNTSLLTLQNRISYNNSQPVDESGIKGIITRAGNASVGSYTPHTPAGWSAYFDGTGDYLEIADNNALDLSGDFTIDLWFYWVKRTGATFPRLLAKGDYQAAANAWRIDLVEADGYCGFAYGSTDVSTSFGTQTPNQWTHLAVTRSGSTLRTFRNGVLQTTRNSVTQDFTSTYVLRIGAANALNVNELFNGYISNVRIVKGTAVYTSNFTPSTTPLEPIANTSLLTLRGPSFTDDGPNRFAITRNGDTRITPFSPFKTHTIVPNSHSVYFDGAGDWLSVPNNTALQLGSSEFTIEAWVYPTAIDSGGTSVIMGKYNPSPNLEWFLGITSTVIRIRYSVNGSSVVGNIDATYSVPLNQWTHIAVSRVGNVLRYFANGTQIGSDISFTSTFYEGSGTFDISNGNNDDTSRFIGYISNVRVVKGSAIYTSNFTPSTTPLTNVANTSLLTCQSSTVIDNSNNALAITVNGNAQPTKFNPFGETITTGVQYSPASHGGSYYFDGTGDYLTVPDSADTEFGSANFTIELWFYANQITASTQLLGKDWWTPFYFEGSNLVTYLSSNGSTWDIASNQVIITSPSPRTWYHVAMVRNGTSIRAYVNGALALSLTSSAALHDGNYPITIARRGTTDFNGYISNIRIVKGSALYTSAFVPPDAPPSPVAGTTLLLNGTNAAIADGVGKNVLETVGNARIINGIKKYGTGSMYFDGTGDYLSMRLDENLKISNGNYTFECWLYRINSNDGAIYVDRVSSPDFSGVLFGIRTNKVFLLLSNSGSSWNLNTYATTQGNDVPQNQWVHISISREGSSWRVFINGSLSYTSTLSGTVTQTQSLAYVGYDPGGVTSFSGYIDDLRITKGVARYTSNFTPPTSSFKLK